MTTEEIKTLLTDFYRNINEDTCSEFELNMKNAMLDSEGNLKTSISEKTFGIALYAIFNGVKKTREADARRKLAMLNSSNSYYGNVGDKFKGKPLHVTLTKTNYIETMYGTSVIWNMRDTEGHTIIWFSSSCPSYSVMTERRKLVDEIGDYCWSKYNAPLKECEETHSDDEVLINMINKNKIMYELETSIDNGFPIEFDIVGGSIKEHKEYTDRDGVTTKQTLVTRCKIENIKLIA